MSNDDAFLYGFISAIVPATIVIVALTIAAGRDAANTEPPAACPVPPESTTVCGYVERDRPNHAGKHIRITGCGPYDG